MKLDIERQMKAARLDILGECSLHELFQELHRRANDDVEEDEVIDWEEGLTPAQFERLMRQFPHYFRDKEVG